MKPRRATALVLSATVALLPVSSCSSSMPEPKSSVRWHMMSPPTTPTIDQTAPLSRWHRTGYGGRKFYESKEDCEAALDQLQEFVRREGGPSANYQDVSFAQCVSSDDPRLKGN